MKKKTDRSRKEKTFSKELGSVLAVHSNEMSLIYMQRSADSIFMYVREPKSAL